MTARNGEFAEEFEQLESLAAKLLRAWLANGKAIPIPGARHALARGFRLALKEGGPKRKRKKHTRRGR